MTPNHTGPDHHRQTPSCHDNVTTPCPACGSPFTPIGRQIWCSEACRAAGYRRRKQADRPAIALPDPRPRRTFTVYECEHCSLRALGQQRCDECGTFMRKVGVGGHCVHCDEPLAVTELLDTAAIRA